MISSCPLSLDQLAEVGGVRGALICWRSGSVFYALLLSPMTVIDPVSKSFFPHRCLIKLFFFHFALVRVSLGHSHAILAVICTLLGKSCIFKSVWNSLLEFPFLKFVRLYFQAIADINMYLYGNCSQLTLFLAT